MHFHLALLVHNSKYTYLMPIELLILAFVQRHATYRLSRENLGPKATAQVATDTLE